MKSIELLDQKTIDKIAAGEVVERPASVVKELLENALDAQAKDITVEIKDGGISFIRVTDNGSGIKADEIKKAFLRHSTSKIRSAEDLDSIGSLGFRGEALSSISAVGQVELITKTEDALTGVRYVIEGGVEKSVEEIGAPKGTTFVVRNLFFNTPARKKFLKSPVTEGNTIAAVVEHLAISRPDVSFKFIQNNSTKLHTFGNNNLKEVIYTVFGKEISSNLIGIDFENELLQIEGFIGKPVISRGNRNYENYYINDRYIKSSIISGAIEDGYKPFMMQHKYPFTVLRIKVKLDFVDVNVHPTKMEVRFSDGSLIFNSVYKCIYEALSRKDIIPEVSFDKPLSKAEEKKSLQDIRNVANENAPEPFEVKRAEEVKRTEEVKSAAVERPVQMSLFDVCIPDSDTFAVEETKVKLRPQIKIIGQTFDTYWIVEYEDKLFVIDQHAAHEKVIYEKTMKAFKNKTFTSQLVSPPMVVSLGLEEIQVLKDNINLFTELGFEIEPFGGREYAISAVPDNMYNLPGKELFIEMLDELIKDKSIKGNSTDMVLDKVATMSCKAAIKGNSRISEAEAKALFAQMFELDNPYNCPHGRPTVIQFSKQELEKKFKRIL